MKIMVVQDTWRAVLLLSRVGGVNAQMLLQRLAVKWDQVDKGRDGVMYLPIATPPDALTALASRIQTSKRFVEWMIRDAIPRRTREKCSSLLSEQKIAERDGDSGLVGIIRECDLEKLSQVDTAANANQSSVTSHMLHTKNSLTATTAIGNPDLDLDSFNDEMMDIDNSDSTMDQNAYRGDRHRSR